MSTRYYSKKMSRSLSSSAIVHDPKTETAYMTMREGNKVYRVPVMVVHDPTRNVEEITDKPTIVKRAVDPVQTHMELSQRAQDAVIVDSKKALESMDGNWTMKSHEFSRAEGAAKRSLRLRNNAVSELFLPPPHIQQQNVHNEQRNMSNERHRAQSGHRHGQGNTRGEYEGRRATTPEPHIYVKAHERKKRQAPATPVTNPDGSASVYVSHPVGATMPRARIRSDGAVTHVRNIYRNVQMPRTISVPSPVYRPPSPSSTIRDFEMSEDSAPSSPNNMSSSEIHVRNMYHAAEPLVGPIQTSTPPASTRIYVKRAHSDESYRKGSLQGKARRGLSEETYLKPGYVRAYSQTNTHSSSSHRMYMDQPDGPVFDTRDRGTQSRSRTPDAAVHRGEVVRVQVPAYKAREEAKRKPQIPDEYHTYPQLLRRNDNANLNQHATTGTTTMDSTTAVIETYNMDNGETNFGSIQIDNEQKTDINANQVTGDLSSGIGARSKSDGDSQSRDHAPKTVVLQKGKTGFGFVLRGAKSQTTTTSTLDFSPTPDFPALQYLDRVDKGSPADRAGLKPGDFLLEINNVSVVNATHERTVRLIKGSGDTLAMKVVTVKPLGHDGGVEVHMDGTRTLPTKKKAGVPSPPMRNPNTSMTTSMSSHAKTTMAGLMELEKLDHTLSQYEADDNGSYSLNAAAGAKYIDPNNKTASIGRHSQRLSVPLDEIFGQPETFDADRSASNLPKPTVNVPRSYNSPREMKAHAARGGSGNGSLGRAHSTPNLIPANSQPHITSIDIEEPEVDYNRSPSVTNVRLSTVPSHDRVVTQDGAVYAVPFKNNTHKQDNNSSMHYQEAGLSIHISGNKAQDSVSLPPHPDHPPPVPPNRSHDMKDTASTNSDHSSSFKPKHAHTYKQAAPKPPSVHSRSSSLSSNVSSMSSHSEQRNAHNGAVHNRLYEPEPDYDDAKPPVTSLRAARDAPRPALASSVVTSHVSLTSQVPVAARSHSSGSPEGSVRSAATSKSQTSMSDFSNQIKLAAAAREQRATDDIDKPKSKAPPPPTRSTHTPPLPPTSAPPPPPPPPVQPPTEAAPVQKAQVPAHVQKQLEANRKREESHAALLAAVAKRRNFVDNPSVDEADNIEARINRSKSSTVIETNTTKDNTVAPAQVTSLRQARPDPRAAGDAGTDPSRSLRSPMNDSFTAKAEQARQQYLAKKGISTLERRRAESNGVPNGQLSKAPPPPVRSTSPDRTTTAAAPALGGIASVIAQRATARQKSYESLEEKMNQSSSGYKLLDTRTSSSSSANTSNRNSTGSNQGNVNNNNSVLSDRSLDTPTHHVSGSITDRARLFESKSPVNHNTSFVPKSQKQSITASYGLNTSSSVHYSSPHQSNLANGGRLLGDFEIVPPPPVFEHSADEPFEIPAIAPPPPGFDDADFLPPPMEFGTSTPTAVTTVRNGVVTKKTYTSKM